MRFRAPSERSSARRAVLDETVERPRRASGPSVLALQRSAGNRALQRMLGGPSLGEEIAASCRGGSPLPATAQRTLEAGLQADLSGVRVHSDGSADRLAKAVSAEAFTTGAHMFFRAGSYDPHSPTGLERLAHEATHVVQQASGPVAGTVTGDGIALSDPGDRFEREAASTAHAIVHGHHGEVLPEG